MSWDQAKDVLVLSMMGLMTTFMGALVWVVYGLAVNVAVIISRVDGHEKRITTIEERL